MSKLREWRRSKDLTQGQLAKKVGTTTPTICRIEAGDQWPSPAIMAEIKKVTRGLVSADDIFSDYQAAQRVRLRRSPHLAAAE